MKNQNEYGYGAANQNNGNLRTQKISFNGLAQSFEQTYEYDSLKLGSIGWGERAQAVSLQLPEQPRNLEAPTQGDGFVFLDWKEPVGGGAVSFFKIRRRERPAGAWEEAASSIPTEYTLINQPKGIELEYCVVAANRAGDSTPSNTVMVVL